jgi:hypothetical protein
MDISLRTGVNVAQAPTDATQAQLDALRIRQAIDHELDLVESAAALVVAGGSTRVTLAGLQFGRQLLDHPTIDRFRGRVRLEPLWHPDGSGCDIAVLAGD